MAGRRRRLERRAHLDYAIATNSTIAAAIKDAGADYLLAVKANQPTLRAETESAFDAADPASLDSVVDHDKGHGRIEKRTVNVVREVDWLEGDRRFPGALRLPGAACLVRVKSRAELSHRSRFETRYYISSAPLAAKQAAAIRGHWGSKSSSTGCWMRSSTTINPACEKGHGAKNMAIASHFAINLVRCAKDKQSIKLRRKVAG